MAAPPPPALNTPDPEGKPAPGQPVPLRPAGGTVLDRLAGIVGRITAAADLQETLQVALDAVRDTFRADVGTIRLLQGPSGELVLAASTGLTDAEAAALEPRIPLDGKGISARVARAKTTLCLSDPEELAQLAVPARWRVGLASVICVPLLVQERLLGTLLVGARRGRAFGPKDVRLAHAIAQVVAPALDRGALYGEVERLYAGTLQAKVRADALAEIGRALASSFQLDDLLRIIVDKTLPATHSEACAIYRWEAGRQAFLPVAVRGVSERFQRGFSLAPDEGLSGLVLREGRPAWSADVLADPRLGYTPQAQEVIRAQGYRSVLAVPIQLGSEFFGTLLTYRYPPYTFTEEEVRFQAAVADQAAVAIENARLYQQEQERRRQLEAVRAVTEEITRELDLPTLLGLIHRRAVELVGASSGTLYLLDEASQVLVPQAWYGDEAWRREVHLRLGEGISGIVAQRREGLIVNDYRNWPGASPLFLHRTGVTASLSEPLLYWDRLVGVITLDHQVTGRTFTEKDRNTLAIFAAQAAIAIENARLFDAQRQAAVRAERQRAQAEALAAVGQAISSSLNLDDVLSLVVEGAAAATGAAAVSIQERETVTGALRFRRAYGLSSRHQENLVLPPGTGVAGAAVATGRPQWTADVMADPQVELPEAVRAHNAAEGLRGILSVPIRGGDAPYGALSLCWRKPHVFDEEEIAFAARIADQAAIAIQNARLHTETVRKREEAEALQALTRLISSTLDANEIFRVLLERTCQVLGVSRAALWETQPEGDELRVRLVRAIGLNPEVWEGSQLGLSEGTMGACIGRRAPVWTADMLADPALQVSDTLRRRVAREGYRAVCSVPIILPDGPFGALTVYRDDLHIFDAREVALLSAFADQAAIAIQNARLYTQAREALAELATIHEASQAITQSLDLQETLQHILAAAIRLTETDKGIIWLLDEERQELTGTVVVGLPGELTVRLPLSERSLAAECLREGRPLISESPQDDPRCNPAVQQRFGNKAIIAVPLRSGQRIIGILDMGDLKRRRHFSAGEIAILERLAQQAVVAIENARLYQEALRRAEEIAALYQAGQAVTESLNLDATLGQIAESARRLAGADRAFVWLVDPQDGSLRAGIASGPGAEAFLETRLPADSPAAAARAAREGRPFAVTDALDPASADPALSARLGNAALLAIPLRVQAAIPGVLVCGYNQARSFASAEVDRLMGMAQQAAIAIQNARLFEATRQREEHLRALLATNQKIGALIPLDVLLGSIAEEAGRLLAAEGAGFRLVEGEELVLAGTWGEAREAMRRPRLRRDESLSGWVVAHGQALLIADVQEDPRIIEEHQAIAKRLGHRAFLGVPLKVGERVTGVLTFRAKGERRFTDTDVQLATAFADQAAIALENARLYAETRKAYEELQAAQDQLVQVEKLRALGEMAGGVAHDFNNLLAAILGRAQLLGIRSADPHVHEGLAIIERAALDGAETVRRILGFARVRPEAHDVPVDLAALIPQVLEVTRPRWKDEAQRRGAAIEAAGQLEPVPAVRGNAAELREVLVNLVFNAVDAMPHGGRLTLGVRRLLRPVRAGSGASPRREALADEAGEAQELVEVFVRDTGVGMPEEVRRRAFEPFFTTKGVKGSGLGLSVVYGIVSRHGGEVLLESQEGAGTTVILRLPATAQPAADAGTLVLPPPGRAGQIVVVDDEQVLAEALAEILRLQRHQVHAFTDPRRALEHLARQPADLLFTDLGMSEMSGWDLAREARTLRPDLPIILVTGWGHQLDPVQIRERRVNAVLAKPFRAEDVLHAVAELLPATPEG